MIWATTKSIDAIRAKRNKPHFPWSFAWALGCKWRLKLLLAWPWNRGGLTLPACDLGNLFYIWGGMWCWEGPGKGWPKFLLTHKQPGQMQRNLLDLCLNWLRWFRDLEMQSVQNTRRFFLELLWGCTGNSIWVEKRGLHIWLWTQRSSYWGQTDSGISFFGY